MPSRNAVQVMPGEWRWVILFASLLVLTNLLPLVWAVTRVEPGWQFMGVLHNYLDGATYLSKMVLGQRGDWLVHFQHTPEAHTGAFLQVLYLVLGHVARLTSLPVLIVFHVARLVASLFMYLALYQLGAAIWMRLRARRVFFAIVSLSAGLGWLLGPLTGETMYPDLSLPEAYPFFSTLVNVHFPLTIACLAWLVGLLITALRPGAEHDPGIKRAWPLASLLSLALALLYPQALVPLGAALALYLLAMLIQEKRIERHALHWALALVVPAVPFAAYYWLTVAYNPAMAEWNRQNVTAAPPPLVLLAGFALPLLVGLPAILRALRRFERDGDRLMLLWLACMLIAIYLPTNIQRRFAVGMMIPVAYFTVRAIEDVWMDRIRRRLRPIGLAALIGLTVLSPVLMLFLPVLPLVGGNVKAAEGMFLDSGYASAYAWLSLQTGDPDAVVLAAPAASVWVPGWAGQRVVYGHPFETLEADVKRADVLDWYASEGAICAALIERYAVRYVLWGPQERELGDGRCIEGFEQVADFGEVTVYAP